MLFRSDVGAPQIILNTSLSGAPCRKPLIVTLSLLSLEKYYAEFTERQIVPKKTKERECLYFGWHEFMNGFRPNLGRKTSRLNNRKHPTYFIVWNRSNGIINPEEGMATNRRLRTANINAKTPACAHQHRARTQQHSAPHTHTSAPCTRTPTST